MCRITGPLDVAAAGTRWPTPAAKCCVYVGDELPQDDEVDREVERLREPVAAREELRAVGRE